MHKSSRIDFRFQGFGVKHFVVYDGQFLKSLRDMPQWEVLGGRCSKCGHVGWLEKRLIIAKVGNLFLIHVGERLRCLPCNYRGKNDVLIGYLDRNI